MSGLCCRTRVSMRCWSTVDPSRPRAAGKRIAGLCTVGRVVSVIACVALLARLGETDRHRSRRREGEAFPPRQRPAQSDRQRPETRRKKRVDRVMDRAEDRHFLSELGRESGDSFAGCRFAVVLSGHRPRFFGAEREWVNALRPME